MEPPARGSPFTWISLRARRRLSSTYWASNNGPSKTNKVASAVLAVTAKKLEFRQLVLVRSLTRHLIRRMIYM